MTVYETEGNLLRSDAEALVNTVNTVGVMGKGIALQFKKAFPDNYKVYRSACRSGEVRLGQVLVHSTGKLTENPKFIINFPTKDHWRSAARLSDIRNGLEDLVNQVERLEVQSIAIPPLGCGLGGLPWSQVEPLIRDAFAPLESVKIMLYAPVGTPAAVDMPVAEEKPPLTRVRTAVLAIIAGYSDVVGRGATLVEVQKLAYLLERVGEPLHLEYAKGHYGPYSKTLDHVLDALEGHYTIGLGDRSRPEEEAEPIALRPEGAKELAESVVLHDVNQHVELVLDIVDGFNTAYGTELLASVDWTVANETNGDHDPETVSASIRSWNQRKARIYTTFHVATALERLESYELVPT